MKTKVLTTTLVVALVFTVSVSALKVRRSEVKAVKPITEETLDVKSDTITETIDKDKDSSDKEVHKRGIFYNGLGGLASHGAFSAYLPRTYASHYGYNLHLPGAPTFSSSALASAPSVAYAHSPASFLRYPVGTHFKAGFAALPAATALHSAAVLPHAHFAHAPASVAAFASDASAASWPHAHLAAPAYAAAPAAFPAPAIAPAPLPAVAAAPAFFAAPAVTAPAPAVAAHHPVFAAPAVAAPAPAVAAAPVHTPFVLRPGGAVVSSYNVNYPHQYYQKPAVAVQPVAPVAAVAPAPVQPIQPVVPLQTFRPVPHIQHVQHVHPIQHQFIQTTLLQQPTPVAVPAAPVVPAAPAVPAFPVQPTFPVFPAIPAVPAVPAAPVVPASPPTRPFIPVQPAAVPQFPVSPLPGPPTPPDSGSAVASPQIPPPIAPEPELPQPTQAPWKPVVGRPSITLMPPYGAPGEAYLPPAAPSQQLQQQPLSSSLFDNLTEAEIEHIFSQAAQAQQQHQNHYHQHRNSYQHY